MFSCCKFSTLFWRKMAPKWLNLDTAAGLAIRNQLPLAECAHFGQHRTAHALYDAVVARYSLPASAALGRLLLPYLFPELSAFATVEDLPPMFITLYFIVTLLPDPLRSIRDHYLSLDPTSLTVDLLEQHLLVAETSAVAVGAARGTPRPPFFEGCSPSPLAPSYASAAAADISATEDVGATSTSAKRRSSKGKGGRGGGGGSGGGGGGSGSGGGGSNGGGGGSGGGGGGGSGGSGGGGIGGGRTGPRHGGPGGQRQQQQRRSETPSPQQLREWLFKRGTSGGSDSCLYVIHTGDHAGQTCGKLHNQHLYFSRLDDAWRAEFDFDVILSAMYSLFASAEGDCYWCVPPDPGIAAAALGASESGTLPGIAPAKALHTFTLDSGASRCFFRDSTTLTPLSAPVPARLVDPSGGPVVASSSTVLPCPAVPSGSLSGLHLPSFSTNLVSTAALQDAMVTTTTPGGQRVSICTCTRTGYHLATFTRRPGSSLYTLAIEPPLVAASAQVSVSGQVAASCSCRLLSHQTLLWHHRLGHPSLPRLRGMHSHLLVSGLPRSLPPLPPSPARPCLPCVKGRQRAAPHSSSFPPTTAPLQTLHMDVWGPARVSGQGRERYNMLIRTVRLQLRGRFGQDLPVLLLHSDRGVMEVARTSMIHAAAPHFLWPFAIRYAAHQLNLWPRVSLPETSPRLRWTEKVGDASVFELWGSRAFVRDTSANKLSARAIPCDVTFDESVPFYRLFPYRSAPLPPPLLFLAPGPPPVDPLPPQGPPPPGVSQVDPPPGAVPSEVAVDLGVARRTASGGAEPGVANPVGAEPGGSEHWGTETGGAEPGGPENGGAEPGGAEPEGVEPGGAKSEGAESRGAEPQGATSSGVIGAGAAGAGGAVVSAGAGVPGGTAATGPRSTRTQGTGAAGTGGVGGVGAGNPTESGAAGARGSGAGGVGAGGVGVGDTDAGGAGSQPSLQPASPLPAPSPYTEQTGGLTERREPASCPASLVRTGRRVPHPRPPSVPGTHAMTLRPSSIPLRVPVPAPPESTLPVVPDPASDRARAISPTVSRFLTTDVTDPSFESAATSALVAELLDFATTCHLDYATDLVAEIVSASPPSVEGESTLDTDVLEDK
ncbi:unnamed protein product [Closterium sp. NIES-54]